MLTQAPDIVLLQNIKGSDERVVTFTSFLLKTEELHPLLLFAVSSSLTDLFFAWLKIVVVVIVASIILFIDLNSHKKCKYASLRWMQFKVNYSRSLMILFDSVTWHRSVWNTLSLWQSLADALSTVHPVPGQLQHTRCITFTIINNFNLTPKQDRISDRLDQAEPLCFGSCR